MCYTTKTHFGIHDKALTTPADEDISNVMRLPDCFPRGEPHFHPIKTKKEGKGRGQDQKLKGGDFH